jgi:hypothetical protein
MKNTKEKTFKIRLLWAFLSGLVVLYGGTLILIYVNPLLRGYIDQTYYSGAYMKMLYMHDLKGLDLHTLQNAFSSVSSFGVMAGIIYVLTIILSAISGWLVLRIAKNTFWFFAAFPVLFISLFSFYLTSDGNYNIISYPLTQIFPDVIRLYGVVLCLIAALTGGWMQRHVSVHR